MARPANPVAENATVTLDITPATGYELSTISAYRTGAPGTTVALTGSGNTRTFVMPAYDVTVDAAFQKTAGQLAVEAAQSAVENASYTVARQKPIHQQLSAHGWQAKLTAC